MKTIQVTPSKPQYDIIASDAQVNLFLAGQGAGKSHTGGIISYFFISNYPSCWGFIGANTDMQLSDSTLDRIFKVWKLFGLDEYDDKAKSGHYIVDKRPPSHFKTDGHNFRNYRNKISFANGCVVFIGSLENYKAHDGKEFAWAILDETKDTREPAVKEVILGRLRQAGIKNSKGDPWNPLYILTSPAKVQWINEMFKLNDFQSEITAKIYSKTDYFAKKFDNKFVTISSTYHNSHNLPENYIENQHQNLPTHLQDMLIFGNPFGKAGGEFYKQFDREKHVKSLPYDPSKVLHLTFDFNVHPYITLCLWQVHHTGALRVLAQIDELCLESPKNSTRPACREFAGKYHTHQSGLFIYGDPSGRQRDTRSERGHNDYTIIMEELKRFRPKLQVQSKAPSVWMRGAFINNIFEQNHAGVTIVFAEHCTHSINDYLYVKENSEGGKSKKKVTDPDTKVSYEPYGHTSDANDYFICKYLDKEFKAFCRGK